MSFVKKSFLLLFTSVAFSILYLILNTNNPDDFGFKSWIDPMYFSWTTMSTVGYGDYSPRTVRAKMAVMLHQFIIMAEILSLFDMQGTMTAAAGNIAKAIPAPPI